jgi:hypothetical protein
MQIMKRIFLAVVVLALVFPALRQAEARTDISIDFFYDNLGDGGSWVEVGDYGYCWQPTVAVSNRSWRPYTDGYWAYTDVGWTWVSYEDFGWATYHYGRWIRLRGRGWIWVPGREWAPAWVSWRTGGDYVGWAPLPPRRVGEYYDHSPITAQVDIDFDIGPSYYNFIDVRYIGEPVLRERVFAADQNVTYITKTVNVTNITYRDNQVYNYGPDYNRLSRYSTRPIQRLSLQREVNVDPIEAARSRSLMKVQGDRLVIAAPQTLQKSATTVAPKVVKEKIAQAPVERGWEGVSDQKAQAELKQKMKAEDSKTVPPPSVQPVREETATSPAASAPATTTTSATPAPGGSPAATSPASASSPAVSASVSPAKDKDKDKNKDKKSDVSAAPSVTAPATPASTAAMTPEREKDKDKAKRNERVSPKATPATTPDAPVAPGITPDTRDKGRDKQQDKAAPSASVPPSTGVAETSPAKPAGIEKADKRKPKDKPPVTPADTGEKRTPLPVQPQSDITRDRIEPVKPDAAPEKPKQETVVEPSSKPPKNEPPKKQAAPPAPAANAPANPPAREEKKKKKEKDDPAAAPTP